MSYKAYFKGKKVTVLGLGLLGKGLGDAIFLAQCGAIVTVTDLKTAAELAPSVAALKKYKNVRFVLGKHEFSDFENVDFIVKAQGVPLNSPYVAHARKQGVPVRMDDELFLEYAPKDITIIGITGTRGKTTTATLIHQILQKQFGKKVHLAGNIRGVATLALLSKIKAGDIIVLELSSWQLQGFHEMKISPHIGVFTNFMDDHMNYYPSRKEYFYDKAAIFAYQKKNDICIIGDSLSTKIKKCTAKRIVTKGSDVPKNWNVTIPGSHNLENIASAIAVAKALKVPVSKIKAGVESFHAVHGRLELLRTYRGVQIYNDNSSATPESTITALQALGTKGKKNIVIVIGGADKGLDAKPLVKEINTFAKAVVILPGTGTEKNRKLFGQIKSEKVEVKSLKDAVHTALSYTSKDDTFLFSPAFASFGMFTNVYDRNDQFVKIIKGLK